jgi:integrase/recombinase XerC/integrase/recombinase XerD
VGVQSPDQVTTTHIRLYMVYLQKTNKAIGINTYVRTVKRYFNFMVEEEIIPRDKNPVTLIKSPKIPKKVIQPFSNDNIKLMLALCDNKTLLGLRDSAIIWVFLDTGLRLKEMVSIDTKDINIKTETIKVMGKGARERVVKLGNRSMNAVMEYFKACETKFGKSRDTALWLNEFGGKLAYWGLASVIRRIKARSEIREVRCSPHTFRHTFATSAFKNGAKDWQVQTLLGHSTLTMTAKYRASVNSFDAIEGHKAFSPGDNLE